MIIVFTSEPSTCENAVWAGEISTTLERRVAMTLCTHLCSIEDIDIGLKSAGSVAPSDLGRKTVRDFRKGLGVILKK